MFTTFTFSNSSNIVRNLATIEADVSHHAEAVLRGRLSRRHQDQICVEQERFRHVLDQVRRETLQKIH